MSEPELEIQGILLNQEDTGENFSRLILFTSLGLRRCLLRKVRKLASVSPPDLFDDVEITLHAPKNQGIPFIKEHQVLEKRMSLAFDRSRFESACFLARFYIDNGEHLIDSPGFYRILHKALGSLVDDGFPPTVLIKTLFLFAREEGLPVKEAWLSGLPAESSRQAIYLLKRPIKESCDFRKYAPQIFDSLCQWLRSDTELRC
jgi:recombinational DNA repair protein (RecF pathway)